MKIYLAIYAKPGTEGSLAKGVLLHQNFLSGTNISQSCIAYAGLQTGGAKTNKTKLSILIPYSYLMPTIKEYKQLSHVTLKDGRVLTSESTPLQLYNRLENHAHIYLQESGEVHSKFSIVSIIPARFDDIEGFILSQSKGMQNQLREKIRERKEELGLATDLNYIQNYVKEHTI